ncbi:MAG: radical SAM protein [bacterium]
MKVLLLNPYRDINRYVPQHLRSYVSFTPANIGRYSILPLDFAYLAGVLRDKVDVSILDAHALALHPEDINLKPYDVVVVNTAPYSHWRCSQTFVGHVHESIHAAHQAGARAIVYGPHATVAPDDFSEADCVIIGEPEGVIEQALEGNDRRLGPKYLEILAEPNYELFDFFLYDSRRCEQIFEKLPFGRVGVLMCSRGCPFNCRFCFRVLAPFKIRSHSLTSMEKILHQLIEVQGCKCLFFEDLTFTLDKKQTIELCRLLGRYKVPYVIQTRVDCVDEEIAVALAHSGCYKIELGVESAVNSVLEEFNKQIVWTDVERAVNICRQQGIPRVIAFAGIFAPGETRRTIEETRRKFHRLGLRFYPNIWFPYPGTILYEKAVQDGLISNIGADWTKLLLLAGTIGTNYTADHLRQICQQIEYSEWIREKMLKIPHVIKRIGKTLVTVQAIYQKCKKGDKEIRVIWR